MQCKRCSHKPNSNRTFVNYKGYCNFCIEEGVYDDKSADAANAKLRKRWADEEERDRQIT